MRSIAPPYSDPNYWGLDALQAPVFLSNDPVLAIAGPGSGKTRTIIAKAVRLIQEANYDTSTVALVTFTKNAAQEMEARLRKALPNVFTDGRKNTLFIGTFHALSYQMLRKYWKSKNIQRKILTDLEVQELLAQSAREAGCTMKLEALRVEVDRYKSFPSDYRHSDEEILSEAFVVFNIYEKRRIANGACDVNDLVRECLAGIRAGTIPPLPVKAMLADEMQDADLVQHDFILAHYSAGVIPTLVADDDQSIYAFRNAAGFLGLKMFCEATGAKLLPMTNNYRSATSIVDAANLIIAKSPDRFVKNIQAYRKEEGGISVILHAAEPESCGDPSTGVVGHSGVSAETVQARKTVVSANDWLQSHDQSSAAVIARTNIELDVIELACKTLAVPYIRVGSSDFLKRRHVERALLALTLPMRTNDNIALSSVVHVSENFGKEAKEKISNFLHDADGETHVLDLASSTNLITTLRRDDQTALRTFRTAMTEWFDVWQADEPHMAGGLERLLKTFASQTRDEVIAKDLRFLSVMLSQWCKGSITSRINLISQRQKSPKDPIGAITLCSAHASKGLEFNHVTVINCDSETWPHSKAEDSYMEELRLFYVAITRAKDYLNISLTENAKFESPVSPFLAPLLQVAENGTSGANAMESHLLETASV